MRRASRQTVAQRAAAIFRRRDGRPDIAHMSNEERRRAGLMDRQQAAEHERLAIVPHVRTADRSRGMDPDDMWADPGENGLTWQAWAATGHADCGGWYRDPGKPAVCACGEIIRWPEAVTS